MTESDHLPARPGKVGRPIVHEPPPALEQVGAGVGGFDLVLNDMRQRVCRESPVKGDKMP